MILARAVSGLALCGLCALTRLAAAAEPNTAACLAASEASLQAHSAHRPREERRQLLICAAGSCPADIRKECTRRVEGANAAIPTLVFEVRDPSGADLSAVRVTMDGEVLADELDGSALEIDPGEHAFVFEAAGFAPMEKTLVVGEGEKGRHEPIVIVGRLTDAAAKAMPALRAWLGATVQDLTPLLATELQVSAGAGVLVTNVPNGSVASRGGLHPGDVVLSADGSAVHDANELLLATTAHTAGQAMPLEGLRAGKPYATSVTPTDAAEAPKAALPADVAVSARFGLVVLDLSASQAVQLGLPSRPCSVVAHVLRGASGDKAGIRGGDLLLDANGVPVPGWSQAIESAKGNIVVRVRRGDATFFTVLQR